MELTETVFLKDLPFLKGLSPEHFQAVVEDAWIMRLGFGQHLFERHTPARSFFLILDGKIGIVAGDEAEGMKTIQTLGSGGAVGWSWLIPPHEWRFGAVALEPSRVVALNGERLRNACEENHGLGYEIAKRIVSVLASRIDSMALRMAEKQRGRTPL